MKPTTKEHLINSAISFVLYTSLMAGVIVFFAIASAIGFSFGKQAKIDEINKQEKEIQFIYVDEEQHICVEPK